MALIRASLLAPMAGTPKYLDPLDGQRSSHCQNPSLLQEPLWHATNVVWFDRDRPCIIMPPNPIVPSGRICSVNGVGVTLDLYNALLNSTVQCNGVMIYPGSTEQKPLYCEESITPWRKYYTQTRVLLVRERNDTSTLIVNQTWQCDQDGQDRPWVTYLATYLLIPLTQTLYFGFQLTFFLFTLKEPK